jgi:hypothetical protein
MIYLLTLPQLLPYHHNSKLQLIITQDSGHLFLEYGVHLQRCVTVGLIKKIDVVKRNE